MEVMRRGKDFSFSATVSQGKTRKEQSTQKEKPLISNKSTC